MLKTLNTLYNKRIEKTWSEAAREASAEARRKQGHEAGYKDRVAQKPKRNIYGEHKFFQEGYHSGYNRRDKEVAVYA
jgi:hypothetical protein